LRSLAGEDSCPGHFLLGPLPSAFGLAGDDKEAY
jgi:hypothetical protein